MSWTTRWRRRLRAVLRTNELDRELEDELAFHLEMETRKNLAAGLSPDEARRQAAVSFGGVAKFREQVRDARWLGWLSGLSLDARLGGRMLRKHPGLTLVGGLGMAVAIAVAAIFDASVGAANSPIPIRGGERLVALEVWDAEINNQDGRILHDFGVWQEEVRSVEGLGAYRTFTRNLIVPRGSAEPILVAEMTATGFGMVGVPPALGRTLVAEDEAADAPPVVVLGHEVWRSRFGGDPGVVGREVRLGTVVHTVVGVMPEGFGFPLNHGTWVPFRRDPSSYPPLEGPPIFAFGRLAPGVSIDEAQAELTAIGRRIAAALPETHRHLRPRVIQYGPHLMDDLEGWEIPMAGGLITLLLVIIAVNVSVLVFARTATRSGEITVRSALGASRGRIVTQFFAEGLVLALVSAAVGLAAAALVLRRLQEVMDAALAPMGGLPFWIDFRLSASAVLVAVALAMLAAGIVGIVPALRSTGPRLQSALRALGGATGLRLGATWSLLIVAQVAFTVAILPGTLFYAADFARFGTVDPGFPADEYLSSFFVMDRERAGEPEAETDSARAAYQARYAERLTELRRRLEAEPEVLAVTLAAEVPGNEPMIRLELDGPVAGGAAVGGGSAPPVDYNRVEAGFFDAFQLRVLGGRGFGAADLTPGAAAVVVSRAFVRDVLGGADARGRRVRLAEGYRSGGRMWVPDGMEADRWYEIVGVVDDLPPNPLRPDGPVGRVYRPLDPAGAYPLAAQIRTRRAPAAFAPRLRELTAAVDPSLQVRELQPLDRVVRQNQGAMRMGALGLGLLSGSVLLLSAAGIYALMSFTVTQRRREIGIRTALGAHPRRILASVFARAARQLGAGAALGLAVATGVNHLSNGEITGGKAGIVLPAVVLVIVAVGFLAAYGPARRGLRVQPMEALRADG